MSELPNSSQRKTVSRADAQRAGSAAARSAVRDRLLSGDNGHLSSVEESLLAATSLSRHLVRLALQPEPDKSFSLTARYSRSSLPLAY
jgi:hypothetical protein